MSAHCKREGLDQDLHSTSTSSVPERVFLPLIRLSVSGARTKEGLVQLPVRRTEVQKNISFKYLISQWYPARIKKKSWLGRHIRDSNRRREVHCVWDVKKKKKKVTAEKIMSLLCLLWIEGKRFCFTEKWKVLLFILICAIGTSWLVEPRIGNVPTVDENCANITLKKCGWTLQRDYFSMYKICRNVFGVHMYRRNTNALLRICK